MQDMGFVNTSVKHKRLLTQSKVTKREMFEKRKEFWAPC